MSCAVTSTWPPEFRTLHAAMERDGLLDHPFGRGDDADMFPIQRFGPGGPRPLAPVPVKH